MGYRNIKKANKLISFLQIEDFYFSMSQDNAYYQFYKNAPSVSSFFNILYALEGNTFIVVLVVLEISNYMI